MCYIMRLFNFLIFAALVLLLIAGIHWVLLSVDSSWCAPDCNFAINNDAAWGYKFSLLHGPLLISLGVFIWMLHLRNRGEEYRVSYAICGLLLIGIAVGYISAYHWDGLNGSEAPQRYHKKISLSLLRVYWGQFSSCGNFA